VKAENVFSVKVEPGQKLMITSDGIHDNLTDAQLERLLGEGKTMEEITRLAAESGRKPDDVTGTLIEVKSGLERKGERPAETDAEQADRMQREVQEAQIQIALLEDLKRTADSANRAMPAGGVPSKDLMRAAELGGPEGIDRKIRDLKLETLPKEYHLAKHDLARLQQETGLTPQQATEQFATQRQIADWQEQVVRAANSMRPGANGSLDPRGVDMRAIEAVGSRMKAEGASVEQVIRDAKAAKEQAERRMGDLVKLAQEAERLQKIAAEYHALEGQKRAELAAAEQSQFEQARQKLESAGTPERAPQQPAEMPAIPQAPQPQKKKGFFGRLAGLFK
jgi:hypothetical protein